MLAFATDHLYLTWKLHYGSCKNETGSPLRYLICELMIAQPHISVAINQKLTNLRNELWLTIRKTWSTCPSCEHNTNHDTL